MKKLSQTEKRRTHLSWVIWGYERPQRLRLQEDDLRDVPPTDIWRKALELKGKSKMIGSIIFPRYGREGSLYNTVASERQRDFPQAKKNPKTPPTTTARLHGRLQATLQAPLKL